MDLYYIDDSEMLYRAGAGNEDQIKSTFNEGRPTAAFFIDNGGLSVDRQGDRSEEEVVKAFKYRFRKKECYIATVKIEAGTCRKVGTYPNPVGNKNHNYHAEIWDSEDEKRISLIKAKQLSNLCHVV